MGTIVATLAQVGLLYHSMELHVMHEKVLVSDKHLRFCDLKHVVKNSARIWLDSHAWQIRAFSNNIRRNGYQYEKLGCAGRGVEMQNLSIGGGGVQNQIELWER